MGIADPKECNWCNRPKAGDLILKPGRGAKLAQTAPACHVHINHFNKQGILTTEQTRRSNNTN